MKRIATVLLLLAACDKGHSTRDVRRTSVDIPVLASEVGTSPPADEPIVAITNAHPDADLSTAQHRPILLAMERGLPVGALVMLLDAAPGSREVDLLVRANGHERMIVLELPHAMASDTGPISVVRIDMTTRETRVNGVVQPVVVAHADRVVLVAATEVTMQQIAEVVAAAGGRVTLGAAAEPQPPEPIP